MVTLYYPEHVHIVQTRSWIPSPYFCKEEESESESVPESDSDSVNEPLWKKIRFHAQMFHGVMSQLIRLLLIAE